MSMIFAGGKTFRSVKTADRLRSRWQLCCLTDTAYPLRVSRFWQRGRFFQHSIRQCQLLHSRWQLCCLTDVACPLRVLGFASGQSECPVGYAKQSRQIRSIPKDRRTRAVSVPQPFPTVVFTASSEQAAYRSLPHLCESFLILLLLLSNSQPLRWVASWVRKRRRGRNSLCGADTKQAIS